MDFSGDILRKAATPFVGPALIRKGVCEKTETKYNIQITGAQHKFKRLHK